jgi:DNA-binding NtrC family response regulator
MKLKKAILVIAREGSLRRLLKGTGGLDVVAVRDGVEGVRAYERQRARLCAVVAELDAPRLGGDLVADWIHRADPELPIIITGEAGEATPDCLSRDPKVRFVGQPLDRPQLISLLAEAFGGTRAADANVLAVSELT